MQRLFENDVLAMLFHCITYITLILANFGTVGRIFLHSAFPNQTLNARLFVYVPANAVDKINIKHFLEPKKCESTNDCV